jgi:hypothetical protein
MAEHICSEIGYENSEGTPVHSDICWHNGDRRDWLAEDPAGRVEFSDEYKAFVLANFREWLDNSGGTGYFYIGTYKNMTEALKND